MEPIKAAEVEKFEAAHRSDIARWTKRNTVDSNEAPGETNTGDGERQYVAVAYWWWHEEKEYRITSVGQTLADCMEICLIKQAIIIETAAEAARKKDAR